MANYRYCATDYPEQGYHAANELSIEADVEIESLKARLAEEDEYKRLREVPNA